MLTNESVVKELNLKPLARVVAFHDSATDPIDFPIAPAFAIPKVCMIIIFFTVTLIKIYCGLFVVTSQEWLIQR